MQRRLYIFAGQRNREHLLDLWWWDVNTGETQPLCQASAAAPPPADGFTQRATLDPDTDEIFVLSVSGFGLLIHQSSGVDTYIFLRVP